MARLGLETAPSALPEDIARAAEALAAAGRFATVEDVVRAGVETIAILEKKRAALRAATEEGGVGTHPCAGASDPPDYRQTDDAAQNASLDELTQEAQKLGLGY